MEIYGKTDRGRVRSANQDSYLFGELPNGGGYAVVCDGMGGYNAGNVAGEIGVRVAAETIARGYGDCADARHLLASSLEAANDAILSSAESNPSYSGMGATVVAVLVEYDAAGAGGGAASPNGDTPDANNGTTNADGYTVGTTGAGGPGDIPFGCSSPPVATATIVHMGDSRAYLFSGGRLTAVTRDHSLVQSMVDNGQLTESEAMRHPQKNMVTRALGAEATAEGDYDEVALYGGDIILLCTDGLTNFVERDDIARILSETPAPDAPAALVDAANNAGGGDNVTAVLLKVIPPGGPTSDAGKSARETVR